MAFKVWVRKERAKGLCHLVIENAERTAFKYIGSIPKADDSEWLSKGHYLWSQDVLSQMEEYGEVDNVNEVYGVADMLKLME